MVADAKQILSNFVTRIPSTVLSPERVGYIIEHFHEIKVEDENVAHSVD